MVDRVSALAGSDVPSRTGAEGEAGVCLQPLTDIVLTQVAAWPETVQQVGELAAQVTGADEAPGPCQSSLGAHGALLLVEPLKWWVLGSSPADIDAEVGTILDLSHARTVVRVSGIEAAAFLNRHLPLDLRESSFADGAVATTAIHHVSVTLWRDVSSFLLFLPRGYALSLWQGFVTSGEQFGLEVIAPAALSFIER